MGNNLKIGDKVILQKVPYKYLYTLRVHEIGTIVKKAKDMYAVKFEHFYNTLSACGYFYFDENGDYIINCKTFFVEPLFSNNCESFKREYESVFYNNGKDNSQMDIVNKGKNIVNDFKEEICKYYEAKKNEEIEELTKKSKAQEIIDKHNSQLQKELGELAKNYLAVDINSSDSKFLKLCFTKEEQDLENKIKRKFNQKKEEICDNLNRIIRSFDLCENREQVMDILRETGFIYNNGIVKPYDEILGEWK